MVRYVEYLDAKIGEILSGWNGVTTAIFLVILFLLAYPAIFSEEPDTHPLLLSRQSAASNTRQHGESAVYRSNETPHGAPLRSGLNIKGEGKAKWSNGRDGDLRDIWNAKVKSLASVDEKKSATFLTVLGTELLVEHDMETLSKEINIVGNYIKQHKGRRVALYLPNCIEFVVAMFASSFYEFSPVLIPYNQPYEIVVDLLKRTGAEYLIAQAGSLPLGDLAEELKSLKQVLWVVEPTSRHMDWHEVPSEIGGSVEVIVWHELVEEQSGKYSSALPLENEPGNIITIWQRPDHGEPDIIEFTESNIISAVAALISALPTNQRLSPSDLFLPIDVLTHTYTLVHTLAALYCGATIAINSVAGAGVDLQLAAEGVAPTVIVASAETASALIEEMTPTISSTMKKMAHRAQARILAAGKLPADQMLTRINSPSRASIGTPPGKLRLLFVSERAGSGAPPLSSADLSDLRIYCNARVVYALTAAYVAGAVAQTNIYDYRREDEVRGKHNHFGPPLSSVEVKLVDHGEHKTIDEGQPRGEITVVGPAVAGGEAKLGVSGTFREDSCLAYV